jgi:hypothetical protein
MSGQQHDDSVRFRFSRGSVDVSWDKTQELMRRLEAASAKGAADAIRNRIPAGATFTHQQKSGLWRVIQEWLFESDTDTLGEVMAVRDELILDLDIGLDRPLDRM